MKKLVLFLIVMSVSNIFPQVNVNSVYLKNPELAVGYVDSWLHFGLKHGIKHVAVFIQMYPKPELH